MDQIRLPMRNSCVYLILATFFIFSCNTMTQQIQPNIDHLVYTTSSLEKGMDKIEELLGVKPVVGGQHPKYGTHNALLSLGDSTYLEIIAPDPSLPAPAGGRLFDKQYRQASNLTTWVLRVDQIEALQLQAASQGLSLGAVASGSREKPDGSMISWKLTDPYAMPFEGALPFLINWGDTPHPAGSVPRAGELIELIIEHPKPELVRKNLQLLEVHLEVKQADYVKLIARIKTKNGVVILE